MLMQPMLVRLHQHFPGCRIDVLAPPWTVLLLKQMPEVHDVIINPFPHGALQWMARRRLGLQLRTVGYDRAYVLPNSFKSALVPFFACIPQRIGYRGEMRYGLLTEARKLDKSQLPLMVQRFAQLAETRANTTPPSLAEPKLSITPEQVRGSLNKLGLSLDQPVAVFCPGAEYGPAKRWPSSYYAELANRLYRQGYQVWLTGSPKDKPVGDEITTLAPQCRNLCGSTDLADAIALISCASLVVSNDSGLMHIAAALNRPMIALFGSSSPQFTPPLSGKAKVLQLDLPCVPCFKRECPLGHFNCMKQLTPDTLIPHLSSMTEHST